MFEHNIKDLKEMIITSSQIRRGSSKFCSIYYQMLLNLLIEMEKLLLLLSYLSRITSLEYL